MLDNLTYMKLRALSCVCVCVCVCVQLTQLDVVDNEKYQTEFVNYNY